MYISDPSLLTRIWFSVPRSRTMSRSPFTLPSDTCFPACGLLYPLQASQPSRPLLREQPTTFYRNRLAGLPPTTSNMSISYTNLPMIVKDRIIEHPYQTTFHIVNGVVLIMPAAATVPILNMLSFTALGPAGGTAASSAMAWLGSVAPGGLHATMQSAAMGEYGASVAAGAAQAGAVASSTLGYIWSRGN
ncbi:hypothetical protein DM02DRAFT_606990 [Periconia macrospinosa]|uniref:Uncharacterized protein n=1 Tax=Periconia macrospinosa TaxID=97972 RepID=A0A2V1D0D5_9PLEO|nr:hypothetical protein DM02DRAFT_606990 [Periconia macrospinosa]